MQVKMNVSNLATQEMFYQEKVYDFEMQDKVDVLLDCLDVDDHGQGPEEEVAMEDRQYLETRDVQEPMLDDDGVQL